jgi:hypothetical protein
MPNGTLDGFNHVLNFDEGLTHVFRVTAIMFLHQSFRDVAAVCDLSISCCDQLLNVLVILSRSGDFLLINLFAQQLRQLGEIGPPSGARHRALAFHAYQIKVKAKTPARRCLPDRKRSADIIDRCAKYTEREAAANQAEQHGRFHAVDLLLVDVKLVGKVGHGTSPCKKSFTILRLALAQGIQNGLTVSKSRLDGSRPMSSKVSSLRFSSSARV